MEELKKLPNISTVLAGKLKMIGVESYQQLKESGSENVIIRLQTLENSGVCLNMFYAIEGAIQGIRWHNFDKEKKDELKKIFKSIVIK